MIEKQVKEAHHPPAAVLMPLAFKAAESGGGASPFLLELHEVGAKETQDIQTEDSR